LGRGPGLHHYRSICGTPSEQGFWPIFEAAEALRVPLYLHPQSPQQGVLDAYYKGFGEDVDALFAGAGIGWHYETGIQIIRMIWPGSSTAFQI
jgi:hypothetical protein